MPAGRNHWNALSAPSSTTSSATPASKVSLTWTPAANTRYLVLAGCSLQNNLNNIQYIVSLTDGSGTERRRFQGRPGSTFAGSTATLGFTGWAGCLYSTTTAPGSQTWNLNYSLSSTSANQVLTISNAWIVVIQLVSTDVVAEDETRTFTSSTTFNSKLSGTLPTGAKTYLILSSCGLAHGGGASNAFAASARMMVGGVVYSMINPLANEYIGTGLTHPVTGMHVFNAAGGETYAIQYKSSATTETTALQYAFFCALDASALPAYWTDQDLAITSTTSTSYQTKTTVSVPATAADHLVLATGVSSVSTTGTANVEADVRTTEAGSILGQLDAITTSGGGEDDTDFAFGKITVRALTPGATTTFAYQYRAAAAGATARSSYATLVVIQLDGSYSDTVSDSTTTGDAVSGGMLAESALSDSVVTGDSADAAMPTGAAVSESVATADALASGAVLSDGVAEPVALADANTVVSTGSGDQTSDNAAPGDVTSSNISGSETFQFSTTLGDDVTGGFTVLVPIAFPVVLGDVVDADRIIQPIEVTIGETVSTGYATDAAFTFPISLSYADVVRVGDLFNVDLFAPDISAELLAIQQYGQGGGATYPTAPLTPHEAQQQTGQEDMIYLYALDMTIHGLGIQYFTPHVLPNGVRFGRQLYTLVPIEATGFERNATGSLPRPKMRIGNLARTLVEYLMIHDDLIASIVTRSRTLRRYLDDGTTPDSTAVFQPVDIYVIDRKSGQNKTAIEFELTPAVDQDGRQLPARRLIRDTCLWRYRRWDGTKFVYDRVECPYTGTRYFDANGRPVATAAADVCGKRLPDCRQRFGVNADLPYGGFPGAGRNSGG